MKIVAAVKQVAVRDSVIRIGTSGKWIEEQDLNFEVDGPDARAPRAALRFAEKHGREVVMLCAGPDRTGRALRKRLPRSAGHASHTLLQQISEFGYVGAGPVPFSRRVDRARISGAIQHFGLQEKFLMEERCQRISLQTICRFNASIDGSTSGQTISS